MLVIPRVSFPSFEFISKHVSLFSKNSFQIGHESSKQFTVLLEFRTRGWRKRASDTHARVVVSKLYDVTNMQKKETRAHFSHVSFGEIFWKLA